MADHVKAVHAWVDENVMRYETPTTVRLSEFRITDDKGIRGSFEVALDGKPVCMRSDDGDEAGGGLVPVRCSLAYEGNGQPVWRLPMFCSPLGAPASFGAVDLTPETCLAIDRLLASVLPSIKPLGLDRASGEMVTYMSHSDAMRIVDRARFDACVQRITADGFFVEGVLDGVASAVQSP